MMMMMMMKRCLFFLSLVSRCRKFLVVVWCCRSLFLCFFHIFSLSLFFCQKLWLRSFALSFFCVSFFFCCFCFSLNSSLFFWFFFHSSIAFHHKKESTQRKWPLFRAKSESHKKRQRVHARAHKYTRRDNQIWRSFVSKQKDPFFFRARERERNAVLFRAFVSLLSFFSSLGIYKGRNWNNFTCLQSARVSLIRERQITQ